MMQVLQRHSKGDVRVILIILRPVDWENAPFGKLKFLPAEGKPVSKWESIDDAFVDIVRGIRAVVNELLVDHLKNESFYDYLEKQYQEALAAYERAIAIDQNNILAYINKGNALYSLKRYKEALELYIDAERIDDENAVLWNSKGKVLYQLSSYEEALAAH